MPPSSFSTAHAFFGFVLLLSAYAIPPLRVPWPLALSFVLPFRPVPPPASPPRLRQNGAQYKMWENNSVWSLQEEKGDTWAKGISVHRAKVPIETDFQLLHLPQASLNVIFREFLGEVVFIALFGDQSHETAYGVTLEMLPNGVFFVHRYCHRVHLFDYFQPSQMWWASI
jgi:hypothetical protein